ncbi:MAG TPA: NADP-dependent oxidoreductase [Rhizobiaceae bacterium]|nr:NADP-dependent oxidoreductase [Rhizobiaceae bacterium]
MRTVTQRAFGGPEVLTPSEGPDPVLGPGEILIAVKAAGVNPVDAAVRAGLYPLLGDPPFVLGWDVSGTIEAVGTGVTDVSVGEAVYGMPRFPNQAAAYAEKVAAPAGEIAPKPRGLNHIHAAALPLAGLTAWQGLVDAGGLRTGQRVLVHGAGGGVGHLAVQIAKARGASVIATASEDKRDFVRNLGADEVIDYRKEDFTRRAQEIDIALETVGGDHANETVKTLRWGGVLVSLLAVNEAASAAARERRITVARVSVRPDRAALLELGRLVEAGKLKIHVERTFDLAEAAAAHVFLGTKPKGKIVLTT